MKQKDPIWNFFVVVEQDNKTSASCIDCKTVVSAKAPRIRAHREKCLANRPSKKRPLPVDDIPAAKLVFCYRYLRGKAEIDW